VLSICAFLLFAILCTLIDRKLGIRVSKVGFSLIGIVISLAFIGVALIGPPYLETTTSSYDAISGIPTQRTTERAFPPTLSRYVDLGVNNLLRWVQRAPSLVPQPRKYNFQGAQPEYDFTNAVPERDYTGAVPTTLPPTGNPLTDDWRRKKAEK